MIYNVVISENAENDIKDIYNHIKYSLCAPKAAARIADLIEKQIMSLEYEPERFRIYDREPWKSRGMRQVTAENYIIFYIPDNDTRTVTVIRVIYGGRDIDNIL